MLSFKKRFSKSGEHSFQVFRSDLDGEHWRLYALEFEGDVAVVARVLDGGEYLIGGNVTVAENGGSSVVTASGSAVASARIVHHAVTFEGVLGVYEADMGQQL